MWTPRSSTSVQEKAFSRYDETSLDSANHPGSRSSLLQSGKHEEAKKALTEAIVLTHDDHTAYFNQGVAFYSLGKYEEVIRDYTVVIRLYPKNDASHTKRGIASFEPGKLYDAIRDGSKAIELNLRYVKAYNNRGLVYLRQGKTAEAERDIAKPGKPLFAPPGMHPVECTVEASANPALNKQGLSQADPCRCWIPTLDNGASS